MPDVKTRVTYELAVSGGEFATLIRALNGGIDFDNDDPANDKRNKAILLRDSFLRIRETTARHHLAEIERLNAAIQGGTDIE